MIWFNEAQNGIIACKMNINHTFFAKGICKAYLVLNIKTDTQIAEKEELILCNDKYLTLNLYPAAGFVAKLS